MGRYLVSLGIFVFLGACEGDPLTTPTLPRITPTAAVLNGEWNMVGFFPPGSGESWNLMVTGSVLTGTGGWSLETCCGGNLTISGLVRGDSLHLDVKYGVTVGFPGSSHSSPAHYDAILQSDSVIIGSSTTPLHMHKVVPRPD